MSVTVGARYRHYSGKEYEIVAVAQHSETLENLVVYRALCGSYGVWVRPMDMFTENVTIEGRYQPRFMRLA